MGKGWINADGLNAYDQLVTLDNQLHIVKSNTRITKSMVMYNFEIADYHTFAITDEQTWVHNCGNGPKANGGDAKKHGKDNHNNAIDDRIDQLKNDTDISNIRKNQQQVDVNGNKVGTNRPDIQYDKDGCHHCVEYDNVPKNSTKHGQVIQANDPDAIVELNLL